jgi:hypothetical protein
MKAVFPKFSRRGCPRQSRPEGATVPSMLRAGALLIQDVPRPELAWLWKTSAKPTTWYGVF